MFQKKELNGTPSRIGQLVYGLAKQYINMHHAAQGVSKQCTDKTDILNNAPTTLTITPTYFTMNRQH